ncbi:PSP1 C-terminal conserved region-domain-containing protein [Chytriomyces sp. MP71]|nr:PSP1 C-terminal conserved region-domain-containing protein [Chytriomyces sp. MP71]
MSHTTGGITGQLAGMNLGGGRYTPDPTSTSSGIPAIDTFDNDDEDDLVLSRKRNIRNRTASTPNAMLGVPGGGTAFMDDYDPNGKWGGPSGASTPAGGWPGNQSIWNGEPSGTNTLSPNASTQSKQYRSLSFSLEQQQQMQQQQQQQQVDLQRRSSFVTDDGTTNPYARQGPPSRARTPLAGFAEEGPASGGPTDFSAVSAAQDYGFNSGRSRSKSSGAAYGLPDPYGASANGILGHSPGGGSGAYDPLGSIWSNHPGGDASVSSILHRRSSTQPSMMEAAAAASRGWESGGREALRDAEESLFPTSDADRYRRRHSHAPNMYAELAGQMVSGRSDQADLYDTRRRHSLAGPPLYSNYLNELDALYDGGQKDPLFDGIDDYFENTEHRTKAWVEAGKNLQKQAASYTQQYWPVYVVEFKAGRIDYFHAGECAVPGQVIRGGDLVIVEADRGKDLGKVVHDNLANLAQLHLFQSQHKDIMVESLISSKEIQPKRIYGLASGNEIGLLVSKAQDEAKAMAVCQAKIRQRKLPMEIVDAEYQWDRKKLTFYFVAERRVDFRELIRDLFKLYKTRIWMCAVDPTKMPRPF